MSWIYSILCALINVVVIISFKVLCDWDALPAGAAGAVRNLFGLIAALPLIVVHAAYKPREFVYNVNHKTNIALGLIGGASMALWPIVFVNMDTHIAMTFLFGLPFVANIMFYIFCKEQIPGYVWVVKFISLFGVIIILRPEFSSWTLYHTLGLVCILLWAVSAVLTKLSATSKPPIYISIYYYLIWGTIGTIVFSVPALKNIDYSFWAWFLLVGLINTVGNIFMFLAFKHGNGYIVQTMEFLKFIVVGFVDTTLFDISIATSTIIGSIIVISSIIYMIIREEFGRKAIY